MPAPSELQRPVLDERWNLVLRIAASPAFVRSPRLTEFLLYVCERALEGKADEISEHQIGVRVFNRPENYNSNDDSIVRSHARLLRQRMDAYFQEYGKEEEIHVCIPKGHYVPIFQLKPPVTDSPEIAPSITVTNHGRDKRIWLVAAGLGVLFALVLILRWRSIEQPPSSTAHIFWKEFFAGKKDVLVVPADSSLALLEDLTHRPVHLPEYLSRKYRIGLSSHEGWKEGLLSDIAARQYTSMADLNLTVRLIRMHEADGRQIGVRYVRDLQLSDLKTGSAILIGGPHANPWEELFEDRLNFQVDSNLDLLQNTVRNKAPLNGESKIYSEPKGDSALRAYGLLVFSPGLHPGTHVLIVEGTSSAGTECAADFLLDDISFGSFLDRISKRDIDPPYFEVLLQSAKVGGNAQQPQVVAYRILKP